MNSTIRWLMLFGFVFSFLGLLSVVIFDFEYFGKLVFFLSLILIIITGVIHVFFMKVEINGKPASAGLKIASVGSAVLVLGVAFMFSALMSGSSFFLVFIGVITMVIGIVIHISYFF